MPKKPPAAAPAVDVSRVRDPKTGRFPPRPGKPAGGPGLFGAATGHTAPQYSATHQMPAELKRMSIETRAEFRAQLVQHLGKVNEVYVAALDDPDIRVGLVAAKQISVEIWGQPTQPIEGAEGGPIEFRWANPEPPPE